jgi:hypothetical protein
MTPTIPTKLFLLLALPLALAIPDPSPILNARASTCTPVAGGSSSIDDVPAIRSAIASCSSGTIVIPSGTTYYLNSVLDFAGCSGCDFQVEGLLKFASSTSYWSGKTAMINVKNINGLKIRSLTGKGVIDGNGQDAYVNSLIGAYAYTTVLLETLIYSIDGIFLLRIAVMHVQHFSTYVTNPFIYTDLPRHTH